MSEIELTGLDGSNPLGFLAAVGVVRVLADHGHDVRMRWALAGTWRAVICAPLSRESLLALLDQDRRTWAGERALLLRYSKEGGDGSVRDLKPRPDDLGRWLSDLVEGGSARSLALAAAFFTETAQDNNGNTKPTALHFTAGQQQFLAMAALLQAGVTGEDLEEALFGPWRYRRELPVFGWDASAGRDYALRASDPSKDKKTGVPGADWLAFLGLAALPVAPVGAKVLTPGCSGGWKTGSFCWPLWTGALGLPTIQSLLVHPAIDRLDAKARDARGIGAVYSCGIRRSDQGGYGSFQPARPC